MVASYSLLTAYDNSSTHFNSASSVSSARSDISSPVDIDRYLKEVSLTEAGLTGFFKCYNNPFYKRRFLPSCFVHVTDFLKFLPGQQDPWSYVTTIFSLFLTKLKGCYWTNVFALNDLLEDLPRYLEPLTTLEKFREHFKEELRQKIVLFTLRDPAESVDLLMIDFDRYHDMLTKYADFQFETTRFLDTACDRLIWDPMDDKLVWESFKRLGSNLTVLADKRIITVENCNEILWSLVHSFEKFLSICGASLKPKWYDGALKEVNDLAFLRGEEVDPLMETKASYLTKALNLGYAHVVMLQKNLHVPQN